MWRLSLLALLLPGLLWAAADGSSGWTCQESKPATVTIDSGSNRLFIMYAVEEVDSGVTMDVATIGTVAETETFGYTETGATNDSQHYVWIWNEAAIASMSGTTVVATDSTGTDGTFIWGTVTNADQTALSAFDDTSFTDNTTQYIEVTTTSSMGDLIIVTAMRHANTSGDFDSFDTLTIGCQNSPESSRDIGLGSGNGGDGTTRVTHTNVSGPPDNTATSLIILNGQSALLRRRRD